MSDYDLLVLLSVILAVIVVVVLAVALIEVRRRLRADLGEPRDARRRRSKGVEAEHLQPLEGSVKAINAQFDVILSALPGIGRKAAVVAERRPR